MKPPGSKLNLRLLLINESNSFEFFPFDNRFCINCTKSLWSNETNTETTVKAVWPLLFRDLSSYERCVQPIRESCPEGTEILFSFDGPLRTYLLKMKYLCEKAKEGKISEKPLLIHPSCGSNVCCGCPAKLKKTRLNNHAGSTLWVHFVVLHAQVSNFLFRS